MEGMTDSLLSARGKEVGRGDTGDPKSFGVTTPREPSINSVNPTLTAHPEK